MSREVELMKRYQKLAHAMQSGVAFARDKSDLEPKHLRVGINTAMSDHGGLAKLMMDKGLITEEEYLQAIGDSMEREVEMYRQRIQSETGTKAHLA